MLDINDIYDVIVLLKTTGPSLIDCLYSSIDDQIARIAISVQLVLCLVFLGQSQFIHASFVIRFDFICATIKIFSFGEVLRPIADARTKLNTPEVLGNRYHPRYQISYDSFLSVFTVADIFVVEMKLLPFLVFEKLAKIHSSMGLPRRRYISDIAKFKDYMAGTRRNVIQNS